MAIRYEQCHNASCRTAVLLDPTVGVCCGDDLYMLQLRRVHDESLARPPTVLILHPMHSVDTGSTPLAAAPPQANPSPPQGCYAHSHEAVCQSFGCHSATHPLGKASMPMNLITTCICSITTQSDRHPIRRLRKIISFTPHTGQNSYCQCQCHRHDVHAHYPGAQY